MPKPWAEHVRVKVEWRQTSVELRHCCWLTLDSSPQVLTGSSSAPGGSARGGHASPASPCAHDLIDLIPPFPPQQESDFSDGGAGQCWQDGHSARNPRR